eukprot:COSAG01_NODE_3309_length_6283_cov_5.946798_8_plen_116_part_00
MCRRPNSKGALEEAGGVFALVDLLAPERHHAHQALAAGAISSMLYFSAECRAQRGELVESEVAGVVGGSAEGGGGARGAAAEAAAGGQGDSDTDQVRQQMLALGLDGSHPAPRAC